MTRPSISTRCIPRCPRAVSWCWPSGDFNYAAEPAPPDTYVELYTVTTVSEVSREEFALSGKVTRLGLSGANYSTVPRRGARHQCVRPVRAAAAGRIPGRRPRWADDAAFRSPWRRMAWKPAGDPAVRGRARQRRRIRRSCGDARRRRRPRARAQRFVDRSAAASATAPRLGGGARQRGAGHTRRDRHADPRCRQRRDAVPAFRAQAAAAHVSRRRQ